MSLGVCLCGGYNGRHRSTCPYPLFRCTPLQERAWLLACRIRAEQKDPQLVLDVQELARLSDDGCPHHEEAH